MTWIIDEFYRLTSSNEAMITSATAIIAMVAWAFAAYFFKQRRSGSLAVAVVIAVSSTTLAVISGYPNFAAQDALWIGASMLALTVVGGILYGSAPDSRK